MKLPSRVKVGPHVYRVISDKGLGERASAAGICGADSQEIRIDSALGRTVKKETLLHECGHAAWTQTELDRKYSDDDEETVLWSLTPLLLGILRDNPELVRFLLEEDK